MATNKIAKRAKKSSNPKRGPAAASTTSARSTVSGPARKDVRGAADALTAKMDGTQALAARMPFNPNKAGEYGRAALDPQAGAVVEPSDPSATGSTLTEWIASDKVGSGK